MSSLWVFHFLKDRFRNYLEHQTRESSLNVFDGGHLPAF
jgi:hypothetical protein